MPHLEPSPPRRRLTHHARRHPRFDADGVRLLRVPGGPVRRPLRRPDGAEPPQLRHRRRARRHAAAAHPRLRRRQEVLRDLPRPVRRPGLGRRAGHRGRGRRGVARRPRRPLPARRLPDGVGHADEHERQRGRREPGHPAPRRRRRVEGPRAPERPREHGPELERRVSDGDARRRGARARGAAPARARRARRRARGQGACLRQDHQDRPHALHGRDAAHARPGILRLRRAGQPRRGARPRRPAAAPEARAGGHGRRHGPEHDAGLRRRRRGFDRRGDGLVVRDGREQVRGARGPRRRRRGPRLAEHGRLLPEQDRQRPAAPGLRAPLRLRRALAARERARVVDHARQGEPDAVRGREHGRGARLRQPDDRDLRRRHGPLRIERLQARHDRRVPRVGAAPRGRVRLLPEELRRRRRGQRDAHRGAHVVEPHARHGAEPAHRLRQRGQGREEGARGRHVPRRSRGGPRPLHGGPVRRLGPARGHDRPAREMN
mmetsp:Transcript_2835/g.9522  ORF Transcript_2835/g.9522 Transcript_2835/m.9522 type:complete len:490 (+) Transcript_2835:17-1486(+)